MEPAVLSTRSAPPRMSSSEPQEPPPPSFREHNSFNSSGLTCPARSPATMTSDLRRKATLLSLSDDILYQIVQCIVTFKHLPPQNDWNTGKPKHREPSYLLNLAKCSRRLYKIAEPALYSHLHFGSYDSATKIQCYLSTVLARPSLANRLRILHLDLWSSEDYDDPDMSGFTKGDIDRIIGATLAVTSTEEKAAAWAWNVQQGNSDAITALLLAITPSIQELEISSWQGGEGAVENPFTKARLQHARNLQICSEPSPYALANLKSITVEAADWSCGMSPSSLGPFLAIPSVIRFFGAAWSGPSDEDAQYQDLFDPFDHSFLQFANITDLTMHSCIMDSGFLTRCLRSFPALKRLGYQHPMDSEETFVPPAMLEALEPLKSTLEELNIIIDEHDKFGRDEREDKMIGSFSEFMNLQSLSITANILIDYLDPSGDGNSTPWISQTAVEDIFVNIFPSSLRELTLYSCGMLQKELATGCILHLVEEIPSRFPHLKHLTINDNVESENIFSDTEDTLLENLCRKAGIELDMTVGEPSLGFDDPKEWVWGRKREELKLENSVDKGDCPLLWLSDDILILISELVLLPKYEQMDFADFEEAVEDAINHGHGYLLNLALCSRRLHDVTTRALYSHFCLRQTPDDDPALPNYLCQIVQHPKLARYLKSYCAYMPYLGHEILTGGEPVPCMKLDRITPKEWDRIEQAAMKINHDINLAQWMTDLKAGDWDTFIALTIFLAPGIKSLELRSWYFDSEVPLPKIMGVVNRTANLQQNLPITSFPIELPLENLQHLTFHCGNFRLGIDLQYVLPFLRLKSLRSFTAVVVSLFNPDEEGQDRTLSSEYAPFNITHLKFVNSTVDSTSLKTFLSFLPRLKKIHYGHIDPMRVWPTRSIDPFQPLEFLEGISHLKHTLEELTIEEHSEIMGPRKEGDSRTENMWWDELNVNSTFYLKDFTSLRYLHVPMILLFANGNWNLGFRRWLVDIIPDNLEVLRAPGSFFVETIETMPKGEKPVLSALLGLINGLRERGGTLKELFLQSEHRNNIQWSQGEISELLALCAQATVWCDLIKLDLRGSTDLVIPTKEIIHSIVTDVEALTYEDSSTMEVDEGEGEDHSLDSEDDMEYINRDPDSPIRMTMDEKYLGEAPSSGKDSPALYRLSDDLLLRIAELVGRFVPYEDDFCVPIELGHLLKLAQTSRRLNRIALQALYSQVWLNGLPFCNKDPSEYPLVNDAMHHTGFLCQIICHPELATSVKSYNSRAPEPEDAGDQQVLQLDDFLIIHQVMIQQTLSRLSNTNITKTWTGQFSEGNWDTFTAFILCLLPNLQSLTFDRWPYESNLIFPQITRLVSHPTSSTLSTIRTRPLENLHSLTFKSSSLSPNSNGIKLQSLFPYLSLPSLKYFNISTPTCKNTYGLDHDSTKQAIYEYYSWGLETLILDSSRITPEPLYEFLSYFYNLKYLKYIHDKQIPFLPFRFYESIRHLKDTLVELVVFDEGGGMDIGGRGGKCLGSLKDFEKLKVLQTSADLLLPLRYEGVVGSEEVQGEDRGWKNWLVDSLPSQLEVLRLDDARVRGFEGVSAVMGLVRGMRERRGGLKKLFLLGGELSRGPCFKRGERGELRQLCRREGVWCDLFDGNEDDKDGDEEEEEEDLQQNPPTIQLPQAQTQVPLAQQENIIDIQKLNTGSLENETPNSQLYTTGPSTPSSIFPGENLVKGKVVIDVDDNEEEVVVDEDGEDDKGEGEEEEEENIAVWMGDNWMDGLARD